ncbi:hypothetical protein Bca4012_060169 [Brassica carinata]
MGVDNKNNKADHCVYISFDNEDPSIYSFINYLKATFNRHGIYQLDDKSHGFAERIRVLVVVFSKDYTFYAPENIVNNRSKSNLVVVPVLYGVTISSAWQQIAGLDQVTMWQLVLLYSAVLPGHVYNKKRSEYEFMEEIARDVCEKLYPTEEIGIHRRLEEIENLLCEKPWCVRTLGIFGTADIGKTTLVTALFRHMSGCYDASCLIKDFHTKYNENRLETLDHEYLKVKIKTMLEIRPALPDVCELFITGNEVSGDNGGNISTRTYKENPAVLITRDAEPIIKTPPNEYPSYSPKNLRPFLYFSKSMSSNRRVYRLHSNSVMRSLFEHLGRKHKVLLQGFGNQLQKIGQSFSNSGSHDLLEQYLQLHLNRSGGACDWIKCFLEHVQRNRNLIVSAYMAEEKKDLEHGRDQANGMGHVVSLKVTTLKVTTQVIKCGFSLVNESDEAESFSWEVNSSIHGEASEM